MAKTKLPKDANQRAVMIAQIATGEMKHRKKIMMAKMLLLLH